MKTINDIYEGIGRGIINVNNIPLYDDVDILIISSFNTSKS